MAKDGTNRGGARAGAGRKKKALADKVAEGRTNALKVMPVPADLHGEAMPPVKDFMKARQRNGKDLCAEEVYKSTWEWLCEKGCAALVNPTLLEQYAMSVSRWIQCEEVLSEYGFLSKHPTTGAAIASPYVNMSQQYMKQVNQIWYQIYQIVKENCSVEYGGANPHDDLMERLLSARKK